VIVSLGATVPPAPSSCGPLPAQCDPYWTEMYGCICADANGLMINRQGVAVFDPGQGAAIRTGGTPADATWKANAMLAGVLVVVLLAFRK